MGTCDKCGKEIEPWNDAVLITSYVEDEPLTVFVYVSRHFLPTEDCEGSPSRAQYIEGQPRDMRPEFAYNPELEPLFRRAFAHVQNEFRSQEGENT